MKLMVLSHTAWLPFWPAVEQPRHAASAGPGSGATRHHRHVQSDLQESRQPLTPSLNLAVKWAESAILRNMLWYNGLCIADGGG
jgi:hypothetical protein